MSRRSYKGTSQPTTLTAPITNSDLSASVADGSTLPDGLSAPFVLTLNRNKTGEEKVLVSSRSGNALVFSQRGFDGTTPSAHGAGETIEHTISATDLDEANGHLNDTTRDDHTQYGLIKRGLNAAVGAASRRRLYKTVDTSQVYLDDATEITELATVAGSNAAYPSLANFTALRFSSAFTGTSEGTSSTTYTALTTATSIDVTAPASGRVLVQWNVQQQAAANFALSTVLVTVVAGGATFFDGGDPYAATNAVSNPTSAQGQMPVTGLTPGTTYRFAMRHRVSAGTGTFQNRNLVVLPQA